MSTARPFGLPPGVTPDPSRDASPAVPAGGLQPPPCRTAGAAGVRTREAGSWWETVLRGMDALLAPATAGAAAWLKLIRRVGVQRMPVARAILRGVGVSPIRDHYYEPLFHPRHLRKPLAAVRDLPGLDLNVAEQLALLREFHHQQELSAFPIARPHERRFYYDNGAFESGDAEYLYSVIRHFRSRRIIEIGSGFSTLMAAAAVRRNEEVDGSYRCEHICIEPFEAPWLEPLGVRVIRERVESLDPDFVRALDRNDILFIDSSHVIRPQGDVLFEYLKVLPRLRSGVLVHVHDIFTPRDGREEWIHDRVRFWNEQYLLEAFLAYNGAFRVLGALNHLKHEHWAALADKCPALGLQPDREPGSFWLVRN